MCLLSASWGARDEGLSGTRKRQRCVHLTLPTMMLTGLVAIGLPPHILQLVASHVFGKFTLCTLGEVNFPQHPQQSGSANPLQAIERNGSDRVAQPSVGSLSDCSFPREEIREPSLH